MNPKLFLSLVLILNNIGFTNMPNKVDSFDYQTIASKIKAPCTTTADGESSNPTPLLINAKTTAETAYNPLFQAVYLVIFHSTSAILNVLGNSYY